MPWSKELKLSFLMRLPWTLVVKTDADERSLHVAEVPSAIGTGDSDEAIEQDLWESLRVTLKTYLLYDDPIPVPAGVRLPWIALPERRAEARDGTPQEVVQGSNVRPVPETANFSDVPSPKQLVHC